MTIFESIERMFVAEAKTPQPISKLVTNYGMYGDSPDVSFKQKIYYHSISPQLQVGVTGYSRLLNLANIMINTDDEDSKKLIDGWIEDTDFKTKFEAMGNTFLICGNSILEKLSDVNTVDVVEVDMSTIIDKKRDAYGKTLFYIQQIKGGQTKLGDTNLKRFIEFNLNTISRSVWSPCIFESACIPRKVDDRNTLPLVELVVGIEDAMSTIILNNAYPEVHYTFEGANDDELAKESEKIRKRKPGSKFVGVKKPLIYVLETKGQSAYVDYIKYLYDSLSLAVKFPVGIMLGDFTSRASSETSDSQPEKIASAIKRYLGNKLKQELFDPILMQNGKDPKKVNLQVTFGTQESIDLTADNALSMFEKKVSSLEETREWFKDNCGVDFFDDDIMNNEAVQAEKDKLDQQMQDKTSIAGLKQDVTKNKQDMTKQMESELSKRDEQIKLLHEKLSLRESQDSSEKSKTTKEIIGLLRDLK